MLLVWNVTLSKDVLVQVWESAANVKLVTQMGYKVLFPLPLRFPQARTTTTEQYPMRWKG